MNRSRASTRRPGRGDLAARGRRRRPDRRPARSTTAPPSPPSPQRPRSWGAGAHPGGGGPGAMTAALEVVGLRVEREAGVLLDVAGLHHRGGNGGSGERGDRLRQEPSRCRARRPGRGDRGGRPIRGRLLRGGPAARRRVGLAATIADGARISGCTVGEALRLAGSRHPGCVGSVRAAGPPVAHVRAVALRWRTAVVAGRLRAHGAEIRARSSSMRPPPVSPTMRPTWLVGWRAMPPPAVQPCSGWTRPMAALLNRRVGG